MQKGKEMKTIESILKKECQELKKIVNESKGKLKNVPRGNLRIAKKEKGIEYYYVNEVGENKNGSYIKKKDVELAKKIAQRDYDASILKRAVKRQRIIENFLREYQKTNLCEVFQKTNFYRRELIEPCIISDEEFVKCWQEEKYAGKEFEDTRLEIITEKGECVRSKSEKIIADKLFKLGIPYRYECPIHLAGNITVYPDFTILKMPEREEVYLEHLGMMDDMNYVSSLVYKLNTYEKNGIYLGVNLFLTYETSKKPLNAGALDEMLKKLWVENADENLFSVKQAYN